MDISQESYETIKIGLVLPSKLVKGKEYSLLRKQRALGSTKEVITKSEVEVIEVIKLKKGTVVRFEENDEILKLKCTDTGITRYRDGSVAGEYYFAE